MEFEIWHYWLMAAIVFGILEIFIPSFIIINMAVGALLATLISAFNFSVEWQIASFAIGSLISFFTVRPLMIRYGFKRSEKVKTNMDAMLGKIGVVIERIDEERNCGRVKVDGDDWRAKSVDASLIELGSRVEIVKMDSIIVIVKKVS